MDLIKALEYITVEALSRQREANSEKEKAYFQGKKDLARVLRVLVLEDEMKIESVLTWLGSSNRYNAPVNRYTKTEDQILNLKDPSD